jgi:hypothetical protein
MNKKIYFLIGLIIIAMSGYAAYGFISQNNKDNQFKTECEKNPNVHTSLIFAVKQTENPHQINVQLNDDKGKTILNKILNDAEEPSEFKYDGGFSIHDTIQLIYNEKVYRIYGFQYHSVVINDKKGPECQYKGAFINGKWNASNVFDLN